MITILFLGFALHLTLILVFMHREYLKNYKQTGTWFYEIVREEIIPSFHYYPPAVDYERSKPSNWRHRVIFRLGCL